MVIIGSPGALESKAIAEEVAVFTRQLSAIVDYVNLLQQVNTEGVEPMAHPLPVQNVFRADEPVYGFG